MDFPRLVYKSASDHILVTDELEHEAALNAGWHDTVPEALGQVVSAPAPQKVAETPPAPIVAQATGKKGKPAPAVKPSWE